MNEVNEAVSTATANALSEAVFFVTEDARDRIFLDLGDEYAYTVMPHGYDAEKDPDGLITVSFADSCHPGLSIASDAVGRLAEMINKPVCAMLDVMGAKMPEEVAAECGKAAGHICARYLCGCGPDFDKVLASYAYITREACERILETMKGNFKPGSVDYDCEDKCVTFFAQARQKETLAPK